MRRGLVCRLVNWLLFANESFGGETYFAKRIVLVPLVAIPGLVLLWLVRTAGGDGGYFLIAVIIGGFLVALALAVIVFLCGGRSDGDETNGDRPA